MILRFNSSQQRPASACWSIPRPGWPTSRTRGVIRFGSPDPTITGKAMFRSHAVTRPSWLPPGMISVDFGYWMAAVWMCGHGFSTRTDSSSGRTVRVTRPSPKRKRSSSWTSMGMAESARSTCLAPGRSGDAPHGRPRRAHRWVPRRARGRVSGWVA